MLPFTQGDIDLPVFLDPILDVLSDRLPAPIYSIFINFLAHGIALFTALLSMSGTLIRTNPAEWDTQTILPPLITFLSAYLALVTLYRTTGWVFRTAVFFIKWGAIFTALGAATGWYMAGAANGNGNGVGRTGLASGIGRFVLDILNGQNQNAGGGPRSRSSSSRSSSSRTSRQQDQRKERPKPWESFQKHNEWQYQDGEQGNDVDAQQFIGNIVGAAAKVITESGWWEAARNAVGGIADNLPNTQDTPSSRRNTGRTTRGQTGRGTTR